MKQRKPPSSDLHSKRIAGLWPENREQFSLRGTQWYNYRTQGLVGGPNSNQALWGQGYCIHTWPCMQKEIWNVTQEAKETKTGAHSIPGTMAHEQEGSQNLQTAWDEGVSPTPGLPSGRGTDQGRDTEQMVSIDHYQRGLERVTEISLDSNCKLVLSVFVISLLSYGLCSQKQQ